MKIKPLLLLALLSFPLLCYAEKPLIIAHYMTWFGTPEISGRWYQWQVENWGMTADKQHYPDVIMPDGRRDIAAMDHPVIGPYDSTDEDLLEYHILLAKESGIDGFMVNWYGFEDTSGKRHEDEGFKKLLKTAERLHFQVCINLDDKCSFPPYQRFKKREDAVAFAIATLTKVMQIYGKSAAYLKINKHPLFSNFGWFFTTEDSIQQVSFSKVEWEKIIDGLKAYSPFFIHDHQWHWQRSIEEAGFISSADSIFPWVGTSKDRIPFYEESQKLLDEKKIKMITGLANPGFDNTPCWGWGGGIAKIPRRNGQEYRDHFEECKRFNPGFIQIVTWNDFTEGSTIEPADTYGDLYLKITAEYANEWGKTSVYGKMLDLPARIYTLRKELKDLPVDAPITLKTAPVIRQNIEKAINLFMAHKKKEAENLIAKSESSMNDLKSQLPAKQFITAALTSSASNLFCGESGTLVLTIKNPYQDEFPVIAEIQSIGIPPSWFSEKEKAFRLNPGAITNIYFHLKVPDMSGELNGKITAHVRSYHGTAEARAAIIYVKKSFLNYDIGPVNLLFPDKPQQLQLKIRSQIKYPAKASINFEAPAGYNIVPSETQIDIPSSGSVSFPFQLTIAKSAVKKGILTVKVTINSNTTIIKEPFSILNGNGLGLLEADINQDGYDEIVIGNSKIETVLTGLMGGRILALINRTTGINQLYLNYPEVARTSGNTSDKWAEYGGINDNLPDDWPGLVWNNTWDYQILNENSTNLSVLFSTKIQNGLSITRKMILLPNDDKMKTHYEIWNNTDSDKEYVLSTHPDLAPGGGHAGTEDMVIMPLNGNTGTLVISKNNFSPTLTKKYYVPNKNWVLAYDTENHEFVGQIFDLSQVKQIGVWEGADFFTMEVFFKRSMLKPDEKAVFDIDYITGTDNLENVIKRMKE